LHAGLFTGPVGADKATLLLCLYWFETKHSKVDIVLQIPLYCGTLAQDLESNATKTKRL